VLIQAAVLERLGKPSNLKRVQVQHLWDDNYRANVWCEVGERFQTQNITDSFFLCVSPEGGIITSNPTIEKRYSEGQKAGKPEPTNVADIMKP
jgi:hypothetical protein